MAALVASIALVIGISIFSISKKQVVLSSLSKSSEYAFYAADTATECALYWDIRYNYFASTTPAGVTPTCDTKSIAISPSLSSKAYPYTVTIPSIDLTTTGGSGTYCAAISVSKSLDANSNVISTIHADGYSTNCASINSDTTVLQRSVELTY